MDEQQPIIDDSGFVIGREESDESMSGSKDSKPEVASDESLSAGSKDSGVLDNEDIR
jgi:hypothetical protein